MKSVDLFRVVCKLQRTAGSSSSQQPAERSNGSTSQGFMPDRMRPFARSTWPFDCGWAIDAKSSRMPCVTQKLANAPLAKSMLLSVMMMCSMLWHPSSEKPERPVFLPRDRGEVSGIRHYLT